MGHIIAIIGGEGQIECGQGFGFICNPTCKECYEYRDSGLASGPPKLCQRLQRPDELPSAQTEQTFRLPAFRVRLVYAARNKTCVRNLLDTQTCNALLKGCEKQAGLQARCCWNDLNATKTRLKHPQLQDQIRVFFCSKHSKGSNHELTSTPGWAF